MCQCQLSSLTLPRLAAMPPCAATVCDLVGNTLESTATFSPASASCNAARIPEPPAPTTTTSNVLLAIAIFFLNKPCRHSREGGNPAELRLHSADKTNTLSHSLGFV